MTGKGANGLSASYAEGRRDESKRILAMVRRRFAKYGWISAEWLIAALEEEK